MAKIDEIREGFYFTDGEKILKIKGNLPNRPDTFRAFTEDLEEVTIKRDKLYKVRLDDSWLEDLGFKQGMTFHKDEEKEVKLKKSGPSYHIEELNLKADQKKRKMLLSVDEFQNYVYGLNGTIPEK